MMTPSKFLVTITRSKILCVKITVLTGIDIDLDPDCHNHYLKWLSINIKLYCLSSLQKSPPIECIVFNESRYVAR